jgi:hypothetical protein
MAAGFDQADLERCRDYVREELRALAPAFERAGLRVTGVEIDEDNGRPFPDLVFFLVSRYVEGERELRHYLGTTGVLLGGSEVARDIYIWSTEVSGAAGVERLPRSRRAIP